MKTTGYSQHKDFLAAIINSSQDAIIGKDLNSTITSWNRSAEKMFGYTAEEMIGQSIYRLIPEDRYHEEEMIISALKRGQPVEHYETIRRTKSGKLIHISLMVSPIHDETGNVVGASKIARDITKQKQDAEQILQYAKRLEVINAVGQSINAQLDEEAILQKVTDATTQLSGAAFGAFFFNKTDAEGKSYLLYTLSGVPRDAFEGFPTPRNTAVFRTTFAGEGIFRSDDITKDPRYGQNEPFHGMPPGHLPVVSYLAVPVRSQKGVVIGGLFFGHPEPAKFTGEHEILVSSIASQAAVALDNAQLYSEVNRLNKKKDEFIASASHELKTPLSTISGYLQLGIEMQTLSVTAMEKMFSQVKRLTRIIDDLLDISRIQAGRMKVDLRPANLQKMVNRTIDAVAT
ncbi:MAG: PAS domain S-box protein, partial [Chitinophagaceae bacterium]|nr:PAS domain S-box protein [Chitinophagaceae bacterium]